MYDAHGGTTGDQSGPKSRPVGVKEGGNERGRSEDKAETCGPIEVGGGAGARGRPSKLRARGHGRVGAGVVHQAFLVPKACNLGQRHP